MISYVYIVFDCDSEFFSHRFYKRFYPLFISGMKKGIIFTNNWYTRFHNLRGGTYSTIPRDAAFMIEEGEIVYPITGTRISDALPRQLESIMAISKAREWIKWWEVSIPTLSPTILVKDVFITNAIG